MYNSPRNEKLNLLVWIKFLNLFLYSSKQQLKNLPVRTKFCWSWAGGQVLIMRTDTIQREFEKNNVIHLPKKMNSAIGFIGGGNWSTRRKPPTGFKSMTNFCTYM